MRLYIQEHQSEFLLERIEPIVIDLTEGLKETIGVNGVLQPDARITEDEFKQRERKETNEDCNGHGIRLMEHRKLLSKVLKVLKERWSWSVMRGIKVQVRRFCGSLLLFCC